jgi:UDP-3-O-acyl-N-acetylglucosamine deacetylase
MLELLQKKSFNTIARSVHITGLTPFIKDKESTMTILPKNTPGIQFTYEGTVIEASPENISTNGIGGHTTSIEKNGTKISFTEHILSALTGAEIDAATINLEDAPQVPAEDGSSHSYFNTIKEAGRKVVNKPAFEAHVTQIMYFHDGSASSAILRPSPTAKYSAFIQFPEPIGEQYLSVDITDYENEIAWARTYIRNSYTDDLWNDIRKVLPNLPRDVKKSPLLVFEGKKWIVPPKTHDEPVRHKILDAIGNLTLLGCRIVADISLVRPSHEFNRALVGYLAEQLSKVERPGIINIKG